MSLVNDSLSILSICFFVGCAGLLLHFLFFSPKLGLSYNTMVALGYGFLELLIDAFEHRDKIYCGVFTMHTIGAVIGFFAGFYVSGITFLRLKDEKPIELSAVSFGLFFGIITGGYQLGKVLGDFLPLP